MDNELLTLAAKRIQQARRVVGFTGAGISVESGIPPFRGPDGLWSRYDPHCLDIAYFLNNPLKAWLVIKEIFYDYFGAAEPNAAHHALAHMESQGLMGCVITQNIDNLHQRAGSRDVIEYHGSSRNLICLQCGKSYAATPDIFDALPPKCAACGGLLKPDFVFFGEGIPDLARQRAVEETYLSDVWLVIGTTGVILPACYHPLEAKQNGATLIEINVNPSEYTDYVTDIFLQGKATEIMTALLEHL